MMANSFDTLIDRLENDWDFEDPATRAQLSRATAAAGKMPPELQHFYERADGASIGGVDIFTLDDEFADVNARRTKAQQPFRVLR